MGRLDHSLRPLHLPDFSCPPLNEVYVGVQFAPPADYQHIYAKEVWDLYRNEFPRVQEQQPIAPAFETFGLPGLPMTPRLELLGGAIHNRFWFLREEGHELIQFQNDRLLHNWRKVESRDDQYPRFEYMIEKFRNEFEKLQAYMCKFSKDGALPINQCEVSYVNHIDANDGPLNPSDWFRFINFGEVAPEDFRIDSREIIRDESGAPKGRLHCQAASALTQSGKRILSLTLTVRGAPETTTLDSSLTFMSKARELIVERFADLTTEFAHKKWERRK